MRHTVHAFFIIILICAAVSPMAFADSIHWIHSYEDSLKLASREGKPMMVGFYTTWCTYCRKLDEVTYVDNAVVDASKNFVCLKVDGEKRRDVAYGYGIGKFPTILFLDPAGRVIWREFGYRDPAFLAKRMQEVLSVFRAGKAGDPYLRRAFDEAGRGRIDEAMATLDGAIAMYPKDPRLYAARSYLHGHKGDLPAALRDLDMSLSINPSDDGVRIMRGVIYLKNNNPGLAIKDLSTAISINPNNFAAYFYRSIAYMYLKQYDKSWDDVHFVERRGDKVDPKFIAELKRLSGKER